MFERFRVPLDPDDSDKDPDAKDLDRTNSWVILAIVIQWAACVFHVFLGGCTVTLPIIELSLTQYAYPFSTLSVDDYYIPLLFFGNVYGMWAVLFAIAIVLTMFFGIVVAIQMTRGFSRFTGRALILTIAVAPWPAVLLYVIAYWVAQVNKS